MPSTFNFGPITLNIGTRVLGPTSVPDADSSVTLTIDRTVTNGFNSQPDTTQATFFIDQSNDGGNTWKTITSAGPIIGGIFTVDKTGLTKTQERQFTQFDPGISRQVRFTFTVSGSTVAVAGTLTTA